MRDPAATTYNSSSPVRMLLRISLPPSDENFSTGTSHFSILWSQFDQEKYPSGRLQIQMRIERVAVCAAAPSSSLHLRRKCASESGRAAMPAYTLHSSSIRIPAQTQLTKEIQHVVYDSEIDYFAVFRRQFAKDTRMRCAYSSSVVFADGLYGEPMSRMLILEFCLLAKYDLETRTHVCGKSDLWHMHPMSRV